MRVLFTSLALISMMGISGCESQDTRTDVQPPEAGTSPLSHIVGSELVNAQGDVLPTDELAATRIGLYFSAIWCPPCRNFTPLLVDAYNEIRAAGESFEVIFVSADRDAAAMKRYLTEYNMPWKAIPFASDARTTLPQQHRIRGIPALVIIDAEGNVLNSNAVMDVRNHGAEAFGRW